MRTTPSAGGGTDLTVESTLGSGSAHAEKPFLKLEEEGVLYQAETAPNPE